MIVKLVNYVCLAILAAMIVVALAGSANATDRLDHRCNPYTYGRLHSCHTAPVEHVSGFGFWYYPNVKDSPWYPRGTGVITCYRTSPWGVVVCR